MSYYIFHMTITSKGYKSHQALTKPHTCGRDIEYLCEFFEKKNDQIIEELLLYFICVFDDFGAGTALMASWCFTWPWIVNRGCSSLLRQSLIVLAWQWMLVSLLLRVTMETQWWQVTQHQVWLGSEDYKVISCDDIHPGSMRDGTGSVLDGTYTIQHGDRII